MPYFLYYIILTKEELLFLYALVHSILHIVGCCLAIKVFFVGKLPATRGVWVHIE